MKNTDFANKRQTLANPLFATGMILLLLALLLAGYNLVQDYHGWETAKHTARQLELDIWQGQQAKELSELAEEHTSELKPDGDVGNAVQPAYVLDPELPMPEIESDGNLYIGLLEIGALSLELPIISRWSYPALKTAPARYAGSAYQDNMVIAAHNYSGHFGKLKDLQEGDTVSFTDMDGNRFTYRVAEIDILEPTAIDEMVSGDWDLTLFTCTVGGASRVTIRCDRM